MFCRMCGGQLEGGEDFCTHCGAKISVEKPSPDISVAEEENKTEIIQEEPVNHNEPEETVFCSMCGGQIESGEDFCTHCGAKISDEQPSPDVSVDEGDNKAEIIQEKPLNHNETSKKKPGPTLIIILLALISVGLVVFGYVKFKELNGIIESNNKTIEANNKTIDDLNTQIGELNKEITGYKQDIADRIEGLNKIKNEKLKSDYKARQYDSIVAFVRKEGLGPESGSFCTNKSFVILKASDPPEKIKITTKLNGRGTIDMNVNGSAATAEWDETSWSTSTTITVTPRSAGVSTIKFSNNINSDLIKIVVMVVD